MTDTDIKELTTFANEWDRAMLSNNAEEIAPFLSDDWIIVGSDGITTRQEFLHWISSGAVTHNRMDSDDLVIRVYDDTSLIVSRGTSAGSWQGQDFSLYEWSTSTCLRRGGRWFCVLTMLTNASSPQPPVADSTAAL